MELSHGFSGSTPMAKDSSEKGLGLTHSVP